MHPECNPGILDLADLICSTGGMFKHVKISMSVEFIICTESGMLYKLQKDNPGKRFYLPTTHLVCASMKLTTLGWIAHALENMVYAVKVSPDVAQKAKKTLDRMLQVTGEKQGAAIAGY